MIISTFIVDDCFICLFQLSFTQHLQILIYFLQLEFLIIHFIIFQVSIDKVFNPQHYSIFCFASILIHFTIHLFLFLRLSYKIIDINLFDFHIFSLYLSMQ